MLWDVLWGREIIFCLLDFDEFMDGWINGWVGCWLQNAGGASVAHTALSLFVVGVPIWNCVPAVLCCRRMLVLLHMITSLYVEYRNKKERKGKESPKIN
jgi:hypothetical protein